MLALLCALAGHSLTAQQPPNASSTSGPWDQPAAALATRIAAILGPGQAYFSLHNLSSISSTDLPLIRRLLEQNLKARGVALGGQDSANAIHITLSEDSRERIWVAEIVEGNETRVAMVKLPLGAAAAPPLAEELVLHRQPIYQSNTEIIAALELSNSLVIVEPEQIVVFNKTIQGWKQMAASPFGTLRSPSRDSRAMILPSPNKNGFEASLPGMICNGAAPVSDNTSWEIHCRQADDPWPVTAGSVMPALSMVQAGNGQEISPANAQFKAFYNSSRNYFTGVITPSPGPDLPAFYTAVSLPLAASQTGLVIEGLDGKVQLINNSALANIQGTRDWGSDFTVVRTGCGAGTQVFASASGNSNSDSLRAYELTGRQMTPSGTALAVDGVVLALLTAPDGTAAYAVVHTPQDHYEADRVSATCN